jgi:hypothetical protein
MATARKPKGTLTYLGETYRLSSKQGVWPLLQFARAAGSGLSVTDHRGLAAVHAFFEDVIDPGDWGRFQENMIAAKLTDLEGLLNAANQAVSAVAGQLNGSTPKEG